jgi:hypothetical protein
MTMAETARSRRRLVQEAGWRTTSLLSALAGTLVAFGAVTLIAAGAGAAGSALGLDTNGVSTNEWRQAGLVAGAVGALVLFGSFFFGGYTAGRMSRRAGARHGVLVFLLSIVLIGAVALIAWAVKDSVNVDVASNLRDNGVPTDQGTWGDIGLGVGIAAAVAMLLGSIAGGVRGDRWHGRLATAVVESRAAARDDVTEPAPERTYDVGDSPVDRTEAMDRSETVDLRDRDLSVEEEREHTRSTAL